MAQKSHSSRVVARNGKWRGQLCYNYKTLTTTPKATWHGARAAVDDLVLSLGVNTNLNFATQAERKEAHEIEKAANAHPIDTFSQFRVAQKSHSSRVYAINGKWRGQLCYNYNRLMTTKTKTWYGARAAVDDLALSLGDKENLN